MHASYEHPAFHTGTTILQLLGGSSNTKWGCNLLAGHCTCDTHDDTARLPTAVACRTQDDQRLSRIRQTRDVHTNCRHGQSRTYSPLHDADPKGSLMLRFEVLNTPNSIAYCTYQPLYHPDNVRCPHTVYYRISYELTIIAVNTLNQWRVLILNTE
jgi:hypothetical protein